MAAVLPGLVLVAITALELARGWVPSSDDAVIAIRAWDVLSRAAPLVGQATLAHTANGQPVYDLGPLYYFLLTLPEHASPTAGPLLGAAAIWLAAAISFVAAARSAFGPAGTFVASMSLLVVVWEVPTIVSDSLWNPHAAVMWFLSASACLLAVVEGRRGWYPFATFAASLAIQANIVLLAPVLALWALATAVLLSANEAGDTSRSRRVVPGIVVGAVCWTPTVVQQLTGRPGNLSSLAWYLTHHTSVGLEFGLRSIAAVVDPRVMVGAMRTGPVVVTSTFIARESPVVGALVVCVLALLAASALARRRPEARLLAVALVVVISFAFTFGDLAPSTLESVDYLSAVLVAVGAVLWVLFVLAVISTIPDRVVRGVDLPLRPLPYILLLAAAALLVPRVVNVAQSGTTSRSRSVVDQVSSYVEQHVPAGPVVAAVAVGSRSEWYSDYADSASVAWELRTAGWRPEIYGALSSVFGPTYTARLGAYVVIAHTNEANSRVRSITVDRTSP